MVATTAQIRLASPRTRVTAAAAGATSAVVLTSFAATCGVFPSGGGTVYNAGREKDWLPQPTQPIGTVVNGRLMIDRVWYRFFQEIAEKRLGGLSAPTLPELSANVDMTKTAVTDAQQQANSAFQTAVSSGATANAAREVLQNNNLSGAQSIPKAATANYGGIGGAVQT